MKWKYSIGLILAIMLLLVTLSFGYRKQYEYVEEQVHIEEERDVLSVQGNASKEHIFYLKSLNGYVVVYQEDEATIFEYTDIKVSELPEELQHR